MKSVIAGKLTGRDRLFYLAVIRNQVDLILMRDTGKVPDDRGTRWGVVDPIIHVK